MSEPLVSIIIPCYNAEGYVGDAIRSALDQTYPHKEVIVIDDGSTDGSLEVIRSFADRVRFVGFVQPERLPDWYLAADVFVLPSSETWGVVVLEALACGLPVIVSDQTGCWPDALPPGDAARCIFPFGDAAALAQRLESALAESLDHAARLVVHADHLHRFTYTALAERFVRFVAARLGRQAVVTSSQSVVPVA